MWQMARCLGASNRRAGRVRRDNRHPRTFHEQGDLACPTFPGSPASKTCACSPSGACRACSTTTPTPARGPRAPTAPTKATSRRIKLRQRVAVNMENRSTAHDDGRPATWRCRWRIAPTGLTGMQHADGEILAARAAEKFGIPFTLSTMSICSIEDIAAHTKAPFWFQLYVMRDRDFIERLIERAQGGQRAARWCSRSTCRSSASATRTSRTACPRRPSRRSPTCSTC